MQPCVSPFGGSNYLRVNIDALKFKYYYYYYYIWHSFLCCRLCLQLHTNNMRLHAFFSLLNKYTQCTQHVHTEVLVTS